MEDFRAIYDHLGEVPKFTNSASCVDWLIRRKKFTSAHIAQINDLTALELDACNNASNRCRSLLHDMRRLLTLHDNGIHVFMPKSEMADAACYTDPLITPEAFRLVFPSTIIKIPDDWGREYGKHKPYAVTTSEWMNMLSFDWYTAEGCKHVGTKRNDTTKLSNLIEQIESLNYTFDMYGECGELTTNSQELRELQLRAKADAAILRIAVTCNLWLSTRGVSTHYLNKNQAMRLKEKKRNRRTAKLARMELRQLPKEIRLIQEVEIRSLKLPKINESEPTGQRNRPHVRRGHWRKQACGAKWATHRLRWIAPYVTGGLELSALSDVVTIHCDKTIRS